MTGRLALGDWYDSTVTFQVLNRPSLGTNPFDSIAGTRRVGYRINTVSVPWLIGSLRECAFAQTIHGGNDSVIWTGGCNSLPTPPVTAGSIAGCAAGYYTLTSFGGMPMIPDTFGVTAYQGNLSMGLAHDWAARVTTNWSSSFGLIGAVDRARLLKPPSGFPVEAVYEVDTENCLFAVKLGLGVTSSMAQQQFRLGLREMDHTEYDVFPLVGYWRQPDELLAVPPLTGVTVNPGGGWIADPWYDFGVWTPQDPALVASTQRQFVVSATNCDTPGDPYWNDPFTNGGNDAEFANFTLDWEFTITLRLRWSATSSASTFDYVPNTDVLSGNLLGFPGETGRNFADR